MTTPTIDVAEPATFATTVDLQVGPRDNPRTVTVVAMPTATRGLVVNPDVRDDGFTGAWVLTHAGSGLRLPMSWAGVDLDEVLRAAEALGRTPIDWTAGKDAIVAQFKEHKEALGEALKSARFPAPEPDGPDVSKDSAEFGPYPRTEVQATADAIARHLTRGLQYDCRETWNLVKRDDPEGRAMARYAAETKVSTWGLVSVLRDFARVDKDAADAAARSIWQGWEDGGSVHEFTYDWAKEYGFPELPEEVAEKPAGCTEDGSGGCACTSGQDATEGATA